MKFELPKLRYKYDALEPYISYNTMMYHHDRHHREYIHKTNDLVIGTRFEYEPLETIITEGDGDLYNNAAQAWNHTFFFNSLGPNAKREPYGNLKMAIDDMYGSFSEFKEVFNKVGKKVFGSGYVWLIRRNNGTVDILKEANAGNPLKQGLTPLLNCDVWEHAYYLDYQNKRPDYISNFWNVVDWNVLEERYNNSQLLW